MSFGNPDVPNRVEDIKVSRIRQIDGGLQHATTVATNLNQSAVNLFENLQELSFCFQRRVVRDFNEVRNAVKNNCV